MSKPQKIRNKDGTTSWRIRFLNANGKRESRTFSTFDFARAELRRLEVGVEETRARLDRDPALALTVADAYERHKGTDRRAPGVTERRFARMWRRIDQHYRDHIGPALGTVLLADLTPSRLRAWVTELGAKCTHRNGEKNAEGRTLSAGSIRAVVTTLRQIVKANDVPLAVLLPSSLRQRARSSKPEAFQTIGEVRAMIDAIAAPWFKVAAALACYAGMRLGEVASLRWRHIGRVGEIDALSIQMSWEGPLKARYDDGEEAARIVQLDPELAEILASWRRVTNGGPDDRVVLCEGVRPLDENKDTDFARRTRRACKRAGVRSLPFHALRASFATIAANNDAPLAKLQAALGHADIATTAIYVRPDSAHAALDSRLLLSANANEATLN